MKANREQAHIAIVIPAFNEEENITALLTEIKRAMASDPSRLTIIFVNDGSTDGTEGLLDSLARTDSGVIALHLSRNFGHQAALSAGLDTTRQLDVDAVIMMDADMQHPPIVIPELIGLWRQGFQVVYTIRDDDGRTSWFKRTSSRFFYRLTRILTDAPVPEGAADFRLMDRQPLNVLLDLPERARVLRSLTAWIGFRQVGVHYTLAARLSGSSRYSLRKMCALALDALISSSVRPLKYVVLSGLLLSLIAAIYMAWIIYAHLFTDRTLPGWTSAMAVTLLLGGMNLSVMGVIGMYVAKVFEEVKRRPLYIVQAHQGLEKPVESYPAVADSHD